MIEDESISARYDALCAVLNERDRRLYAASEAKAAGRGVIAAVSRVTGVARSTIGRGLKDLASAGRLPAGRVHRAGGGRKSLTETDATHILAVDCCLGLPVSAKLLLSRANHRRRQRSSDL